MVINPKTSISSFFRFFQVSKEFSTKLSTSKICELNPDGLPGWTALAISREHDPKLLGKNCIDQALVRQWIEYAVAFAVFADDVGNSDKVLKEVNKALAARSYVATNYLTAADLLLFFILHSTIASLSFHEKEVYQNVSRWFDHLQLQSSIRQTRPLVPFSKTLLYS